MAPVVIVLGRLGARRGPLGACPDPAWRPFNNLFCCCLDATANDTPQCNAGFRFLRPKRSMRQSCRRSLLGWKDDLVAGTLLGRFTFLWPCKSMISFCFYSLARWSLVSASLLGLSAGLSVGVSAGLRSRPLRVVVVGSWRCVVGVGGWQTNHAQHKRTGPKNDFFKDPKKLIERESTVKT